MDANKFASFFPKWRFSNSVVDWWTEFAWVGGCFQIKNSPLLSSSSSALLTVPDETLRRVGTKLKKKARNKKAIFWQLTCGSVIKKRNFLRQINLVAVKKEREKLVANIAIFWGGAPRGGGGGG